MRNGQAASVRWEVLRFVATAARVYNQRIRNPFDDSRMARRFTPPQAPLFAVTPPYRAWSLLVVSSHH